MFERKTNVTKSEIANKYFLTTKSEAAELVANAKAEAAALLQEFKLYYTGNFGIDIYANRHNIGYSVAGNLTINGEVFRTYDPIDLCFLELHELMLKRLIDCGFGMREGDSDEE